MCPQENSPLDETLATCLAVIEAGWATTAQLRHAAAWRRGARPQLGNLAMTQGTLTVAQVFDILGQQACVGGLFGQVAQQMGLLSNIDLYELLELQSNLTPSMADALVTLGILSPEQRAVVSEQASLEATSPLRDPVPA